MSWIRRTKPTDSAPGGVAAPPAPSGGTATLAPPLTTATAVVNVTTSPVVVPKLSTLPPPPPWAPAETKRRGFFRRHLVLTILGGVVLALLVAVGVFDRVQMDRILPGVTVDGLGVGKLSTVDATAKLNDGLAQKEQVKITFTGETEQVSATLGDLGLRANIDDTVARARQGKGATGFGFETITGPFVRTYHRLLDKPLHVDVHVDYAVDPAKVDAFVRDAQSKIDRPAKDTQIDVSSGNLVLTKSQTGRTLDVAGAAKLLSNGAHGWALRGQERTVELPVAVVQPQVTETNIGHILLISRKENRLWHYDGMQLVKTYTVATGSGGFPTPKGHWKIVNKRKNPTWVNPAPNGWGAGMPKSIGPGAGNPLGPRALDLNASGIRIHGTNNIGSLGSNASHGCIRMAPKDVIELFDQVKVGTPAIIV